jgi:hypothetical protein
MYVFVIPLSLRLYKFVIRAFDFADSVVFQVWVIRSHIDYECEEC